MWFLNTIKPRQVASKEHRFAVAMSNERGDVVTAEVEAADLVDYYRFQLAILNATGQCYRSPMADGMPPDCASRNFRALVENMLDAAATSTATTKNVN